MLSSIMIGQPSNRFVQQKKEKDLVFLLFLYPDPGSNRDGLPHWCLRPARLPIPPSGHSIIKMRGKGKCSGRMLQANQEKTAHLLLFQEPDGAGKRKNRYIRLSKPEAPTRTRGKASEKKETLPKKRCRTFSEKRKDFSRKAPYLSRKR